MEIKNSFSGSKNFKMSSADIVDESISIDSMYKALRNEHEYAMSDDKAVRTAIEKLYFNY